MEHNGDVLRLDCTIEVTRDDIKAEELFKVLKHLKPSWNASDLVSKILQGGYANLSIRCYMKSNPDDSVVFRIWNRMSTESKENIGNRRVEVDLIHKLGEKGVAPKLYASFANGLCYEFFDGENLTTALCRTDEMAKMIAKNIAQVHGTKVDSASSEIETFTLINWSLKAFPIQHPDPEKDKILQKTIPSKEEVAKEIKFLEQYLKDLNSPMVQCHGDPHAMNMMYNQKTGKLILLDYEGARTGYQAADLATFFLLLSVDYEDFTTLFQKGVPEEKYQMKFLRWYLEEWFEITGKNSKDITEEDVNRLYIQVNKYMLFSYFHYSLVFMKMGTVQNKADFHEKIQTTDWISLGLKNFQTYYIANKERFISLKLPE